MVTEFARNHYHLSDNQVDALINQVREGDLSVILKVYEEEIKHPLKNAVKGKLCIYDALDIIKLTIGHIRRLDPNTANSGAKNQSGCRSSYGCLG